MLAEGASRGSRAAAGSSVLLPGERAPGRSTEPAGGSATTTETADSRAHDLQLLLPARRSPPSPVLVEGEEGRRGALAPGWENPEERAPGYASAHASPSPGSPPRFAPRRRMREARGGGGVEAARAKGAAPSRSRRSRARTGTAPPRRVVSSGAPEAAQRCPRERDPSRPIQSRLPGRGASAARARRAPARRALPRPHQRESPVLGSRRLTPPPTPGASLRSLPPAQIRTPRSTRSLGPGGGAAAAARQGTARNGKERSDVDEG